MIFDVVGIPLSCDDAVAIGRLLKERRWGDAAKKVVAVASLAGASELLKFGYGAIGGWPAVAAKLAISAGSCALSERLP